MTLLMRGVAQGCSVMATSPWNNSGEHYLGFFSYIVAHGSKSLTSKICVYVNPRHGLPTARPFTCLYFVGFWMCLSLDRNCMPNLKKWQDIQDLEAIILISKRQPWGCDIQIIHEILVPWLVLDPLKGGVWVNVLEELEQKYCLQEEEDLGWGWFMLVFCHSGYFSVTYIYFRVLVLSSDDVCCRFCSFSSFLRRTGKIFGVCGEKCGRDDWN